VGDRSMSNLSVHSGFVDDYLFDRVNDELMMLMSDVNTQGLQLCYQFSNSILMRITPFITKILEFVSAKHLVNGSGQAIGNGHLGFVGGSKFELKFRELGSVIGFVLLLGAVGRLNQEFSEVGIAFSAL
jgi:hypothetical protein